MFKKLSKAVKKQISKLQNYELLKHNGIIEYPEYGFREQIGRAHV